jgi:predicted CoA-binding protein
MAHTLRDIQDFLAVRRLAIVGVSRNPKHFSQTLLAEFRTRGYEVLPVNPAADYIQNIPCFPRVTDILPPPEAALILTPATQSADVVAQCAVAGVRQVWLYRAIGLGAVSEEAVALGLRAGIRMVVGECPFMFLPDSGSIHRIHRIWNRVTGHFPAPA